MNRKHSMPAMVGKVQITDDFWSYYQKLLREVVLPYQWEALNDRVEGAAPSHCIHNLKVAAGDIEGEYEGPVFQDHGIVTWLEAVGGSLAHHPDKELEALADEAVDLLGRVQRKDGYLNSYFIVKEPQNRWQNLMECHELFCAGHMIEAAIAYNQATGKEKFLNIARKYADYIDTVFGAEEGKCKGYPGHQEIELALLKLYRATGEEKYKKLAAFFLDQRGGEPNYFLEETKRLKGNRYWEAQDVLTTAYFQAHQPVRDQRVAVGHAVRAVYQYAAMAEMAAETGDEQMAEACYALFENITGKQMYITGGIGSTHIGEAFTFDYDLPNNTIYQETCASIGLVFFASHMLMLDHHAKYADIMERALYNTLLSGIARDGKAFFYVNPLEIWPEACEKNPEFEHVKAERQPWFSCACCPPNIARTLAMAGQYIYSTQEEKIYVNLYVGGTFAHSAGEKQILLTQEETYLKDGNVKITVSGEEPSGFVLALRKPGWCSSMQIAVNGVECRDATVENGYVILKHEWKKGDRIEVSFAMQVMVMRANPKVRADAGRIALMRGPLVYCLEEIDNGSNLGALSIPAIQKFEVINPSGAEPQQEKMAYSVLAEAKIPLIRGKAFRLDETKWSDNMLYAPITGISETSFTAVPYALWGNRGKGEMMVWIREAM